MIRYALTGVIALVPATVTPTLTAPKYVAHAGGGIRDLTYCNCLEAFNASYERGIRFFEIDISLTSDRRMVLIHDWHRSYFQFFADPPRKIPSLAEFDQLKMHDGLTSLAFEDLAEWMQDHRDAVIVTDVKQRGINLEVLEQIVRRYPALIPRVVPQFYDYDQYEPIRALGYKHLIFTVYRLPDQAVRQRMAAFLEQNEVFALTIPLGRAQVYLPKYRDLVPVLVHTINDPGIERQLQRLGATGIYTDFLGKPEGEG